MYQEILDQVITTGLGLGILAGAYLLDLLIGSIKVWFTAGMKWSWKKAGEDFLKALVLALGIEAWVVLWNLTSYYCGKCGVDIKTVADGFSNAGMIAAILGATCWYLKNAYTNAVAFIETKHIKVEVGEIEYDKIAGKIYEFFETPKKAVEEQKKFEEEIEEAKKEGLEGGLGVHYSVPIDSYDSFRNTVMGRGYDCDGAYSYQCWDGACLLWMQLGRWLSTGGTGAARGCWEPARGENAGGDFELITNKNDVRRGDVVVFSCGTYGHIGYADADYDGGAYVRLLGQNQSTDMKFCVINMSMATFMGAFRYKGWKQAPAPTPTPKKSNEEIAKEVIRGDWGNNPERRQRLEAAGYDYNAIQALVNQMLGGGGTPTPAPATGFNVGDAVVPTKLVDYNGAPLRQYDDTYTITQISGDRAVLSARGAVWAAMNTANIRKA